MDIAQYEVQHAGEEGSTGVQRDLARAGGEGSTGLSSFELASWPEREGQAAEADRTHEEPGGARHAAHGLPAQLHGGLEPLRHVPRL